MKRINSEMLSCEYCGQKFGTVPERLEHVRQMHPESPLGWTPAQWVEADSKQKRS